MLAIVTCGMQSIGMASIQTFSGTSSDGHAVSGSVEWTINAIADTITFKLTNTTAVTKDAGELFTGINFTVGGLVPTLASDLGIQRTVASNGTFSDTATAQNLSWSVVSHGAGYQLNFNPNAKDAIIAPPAGSVYTANDSVNGNNGHNPFAAVTATFVINASGLLDTTPIVITNFLYGTELDPAIPTGSVPEPISLFVWGGLATVLGTAAYRRNRIA